MSSKTKFAKIYANIGYEFKNSNLLNLALTHRSYSTKNNERLEFLGDSLVNLIIGEALFLKFADLKEGKLSRLRADLVKGETLAQLSLELGLDQYLQLGAGEIKAGGAKRHSILADVLEALIAAIYLDSDFNNLKPIVLNWFDAKLAEINKTTKSKDHKTRLQEHLQAHKQNLPNYILLQISGEPHDQTFTVECKIDAHPDKKFVGIAKSKRFAEQEAAEKALKTLNII